MNTYQVTQRLAAFDNTSPRKRIVMRVLERAKDAGDQTVIAACRRLIEADRLGWKKHALEADKAMIRAFNE